MPRRRHLDNTITIGQLPQEYVKAHGNMSVVTPKGVRTTLANAYKNYNQTPINPNDVPGLTDYLIKQDQPDISEEAHLNKIAADRFVHQLGKERDQALMAIAAGVFGGGALASGLALAPVATLGSIGGSIAGEKVFNKLYGDNWGQDVERWTNGYIPAELGEYLNPGSLIGGGLGGIVGGNANILTNGLYNLVDRRFVPTSRILTYNPDHSVMYRYIGTKDSGYKDLLTSGIIRGNPRHGLFGAKELRKRVRLLEGKGFTESELRDISSNNISESLFNKIKQVEAKTDKSTVGKFRFDRESMLDDYDTYADYIEDMNARVLQSNNPNVNRVVSPVKSSEMGDVLKVQQSHGNNPMATFAYGDEALTNRIQFPGDYAISVKNAQRYARDGRPFGHFEQHPVTEYPLQYNNPDVTIYKRRDGLLSGKKYMVKVPRRVVERDRRRYLSNPNYNPYKGNGLVLNIPNIFAK